MRSADRSNYVVTQDFLNLENLESVFEFLTETELLELRKKWRDVSNLVAFRDFDSKALAEKIFMYGYVSAHIEYAGDVYLGEIRK